MVDKKDLLEVLEQIKQRIAELEKISSGNREFLEKLVELEQQKLEIERENLLQKAGKLNEVNKKAKK